MCGTLIRPHWQSQQVTSSVNNPVERLPLIELGVWVGKMNDVDHDQIASDITNYAIPIIPEGPEHAAISRGFVQFEDLIMPITPEVTKLETNCIDFLRQLTGREYKVDDLWAVNLHYNQSVIAHSHYANSHTYPEEYFSVTYYPQVPDGSAELIFDYNHCNMISGSRSIKPEVGTFVVFPSYLDHKTSRNRSTEPRIVVGINFAPVEPCELPNTDRRIYAERPVIENPTPADATS